MKKIYKLLTSIESSVGGKASITCGQEGLTLHVAMVNQITGERYTLHREIMNGRVSSILKSVKRELI